MIPTFDIVKNEVKFAEWCKKQDPPPIYCEIPDELRNRIHLSVTGTQNYYSLPSLPTGPLAQGTTNQS